MNERVRVRVRVRERGWKHHFSGIGRHTAFLFAQEGASVVVADNSISAVARASDAVKEFGGRCVGFCGDVSNPEEVEAMVSKAEVLELCAPFFHPSNISI